MHDDLSLFKHVIGLNGSWFMWIYPNAWSYQLAYTVTPVWNDHPRCQEKVVSADRWSFQTGLVCMESNGGETFSEIGKWPFQAGWSFQRQGWTLRAARPVHPARTLGRAGIWKSPLAGQVKFPSLGQVSQRISVQPWEGVVPDRFYCT